MKQIFSNSSLIFFMILLSCYISCAQVRNNSSLQKVIIIRHGEKPEAGDNLSCLGFNRALKLADVLYAKFKIPDYIFVPSLRTGKSTGTSRMYQTIIPFAVKYNLNIDTKCDVDDAGGLAKSILKKTGTVLLVWEHDNISKITQALGIPEKLKWKADDFDSIWIITFKNGKAILSTDKENLQPSPVCD